MLLGTLRKPSCPVIPVSHPARGAFVLSKPSSTFITYRFGTPRRHNLGAFDGFNLCPKLFEYFSAERGLKAA